MKDQKKNLEKDDQCRGDKKSFDEPKLKFIEPKLSKHGDATKITKVNGFFGTFDPG